MRASTLVILRAVFYSMWALLNSWCTAMAGVVWGSMGWEEQSVLIGGIAMNWAGFMVAFLDKSMAKYEATKEPK